MKECIGTIVEHQKSKEECDRFFWKVAVGLFGPDGVKDGVSERRIMDEIYRLRGGD